MQVNRLTVQNFRNLENDTLVADGGINVIYGENAQGKTNLMEAIWLFTGVKSFRHTKDTEYVRFGEQTATLQLDFTADDRKQQSLIRLGEQKGVTLNGVKKKSVSALAGSFTAVVFSPDHLPLIKNGPAERRRFLNVAIAQLWPNYMSLMSSYVRALQQRNAILKDARYHTDLYDLLDAYEVELAQKGAQINAYRKKYCDRLVGHAADIYSGISSGKEKLQVAYEPSAENTDVFLDQLKATRREDSLTGSTSIGPHRDDLLIAIDGKPARQFGSQGQQRSAALSLKLAEAEILHQITGNQPVILLDDVMSELDERRQDYILNHIENRQVFITCCEKETAKKLKFGALFHVRGGHIET